ncbi:hypothetical protein P3342_003183 [Pyrenophora teres f. teres]|nr:hypothetical protein P3342_003183 [Pyrenophora teres f. teres]
MAAPPPERPLFLAAHHMQFAYPSPASTVASDTSLPWSSMSPQHEPIVAHPRTSAKSLSPTEQSSRNEHLRWITANTPDGFRKKEVMHEVRQGAMLSFLKKEKTSDDASRAGSEVSDRSRSSLEGRGATKSRSGATSKRKSSSGNKQSSPTKPPKPINNTQNAPRPDTQVVRAARRQSHLPRGPIVVPARTDQVHPFDIFPMPPLVSIGENIDPFRTMFQSTHPNVSVTALKHHCSRYFGTEGLGKRWIPACLEHPHTFLSTLYMASAHHDVIQRREMESIETAALRNDVIILVSGNLTNGAESVADHNIIAVSQLILGEVIGRNEGSLSYHQGGIETMIKQRGGLEYLGMDGMIASAVSWAHLATSVLREMRPNPMYARYCASRSIKKYSLNVAIPESPLYFPHGKYVTLERSTECNPDARKLLLEMRTMIDEFLLESRQSLRNSERLTSLYDRIASCLPVQELRRNQVLRSNDWKYEAIRITAVVQAHAIFHRITLSSALASLQSLGVPSTLYRTSAAFPSSESLFSAFDPHYSTPLTDYSTSPSYSTYSTTNTTASQPGFPFHYHRPSTSSTYSHRLSTSSTFSQRPSVSSFHSGSSDVLLFPRPVITTAQPGTLSTTNILNDLKEALERSNLSECWSDMAGVLLWIGLVMGAASNKHDDKILRRYFSTMTMRACVMLCFEHPEAMHATMLRMSEVVEALGQRGIGDAQVAVAVADTRDDGEGARRKRPRA